MRPKPFLFFLLLPISAPAPGEGKIECLERGKKLTDLHCLFFSVTLSSLNSPISVCMGTHTGKHRALSFFLCCGILDRKLFLKLSSVLQCQNSVSCLWELKPNDHTPFQGTDHPCTANNPESCSVSLSPQDFINLFKFWIPAHNKSSQEPPAHWLAGSLDTSFVNSVHFRHWLRASEISHWEDVGRERCNFCWTFMNVNFTLELVSGEAEIL
jgi:hypothetical protein